jgi:drug/metabolite transporter (DMT)-like permease
MSRPDARDETRALAYGFVGVAAFSLTLPATRAAVADLHPAFVALARCLVAAVAAGALLAIARVPWPARRHWTSLAIVVAGVIVGFPLFSAIAMRDAPASHGAIVLGILPLATALAGALRGGERPSRGFWLAGLAGSALVVAFALAQGGGRFGPADLALVLAVAAGALGYAEGGRLARDLGAWQTISWALVLSAPLLILPLAWVVAEHGAQASPRGWLGFAYVALLSQFLGFFPWYKGLALGGVARVGQLQLLQPFMTLFASALLLHEAIDAWTVAFAVAVVATVAIGRHMPIARPST